MPGTINNKPREPQRGPKEAVLRASQTVSRHACGVPAGAATSAGVAYRVYPGCTGVSLYRVYTGVYQVSLGVHRVLY